MMKKTVLFLDVILITLCCCSWQNMAEGMIDFLLSPSSPESITAEEFWSTGFLKDVPAPSEIQNFKGVKLSYINNYSNYYARYSADKQYILDLVESMPKMFGPGDGGCDLSDGNNSYSKTMVEESLSFAVDDLSGIDFWTPEQITDGEYYYCFKSAWVQNLFFDRNSNTVFHIIEYSDTP